MIIKVTEKNRLLSEILADKGFPLDMRCGGRGSCGRCRVRLLSGEWAVNGCRMAMPADALACRTMLLSEEGEVEPGALSMLSKDGAMLDEWRTERALPKQDSVVVGIDIGTTTLAAAALQNGRIVARSTRFNPQSLYGDNVVSRISASSEHLGDLRRLLFDALREMLSEFPPPERIAISGNSTMTCISHGIDPSPMGRAPFALPQRRFEAVSAEIAGLPSYIPIYTMPLASAYLGGDVLAGIAESQLGAGELLVDLGTNCEMVFRRSDGLFVGSSSAAGPAFEGVGISCGMRAVAGAISHYRSKDDVDVIDGCRPLGLCGSAMVDFLAAERDAGRISRFGRFQPKAERMVVADGISVTERDIESLLKAKAAVAAGIAALEAHCGEQAARLVLAGGFARYLDIANAVRIGMLPKRECRVVGNVSLAGALRLAATPEYAAELEELCSSISEVPLNSIPQFQELFFDYMALD